MRRPRLLFYCQHSVGLGHLVRSMNLADGLTRDFDVTLLNGGPWPSERALRPTTGQVEPRRSERFGKWVHLGVAPAVCQD